MAGKWTSTEILKFLDIYEKYEVLWNVKAKSYRNRTIRDIAWENLLKEVKEDCLKVEDVCDIQKKIKSIKTVYGSELKKIKVSKKSGAGADDVYVPQLMWFSRADSFLQQVTTSRETTSNMDIENVDVACENISPNTSSTYKSPEVKSAKKRKSEISETVTRLEKLSQINQNTEDEFEFFGLNVASQLRKMPLADALNCQEDIQAIIKKHRLKPATAPNSEKDILALAMENIF